ncbi:hypothetical protein DBR32_05085 [Taibaiella sp. KBW10]|uniref:hypothetical protein n=1 Tax=Taibaiella sp. KBW10 TaxID=2153357 RepID=UPI000F59188B|nr:hypothetical protein [Taibaiella sp. KBW10]RQO31340.1 hypothetical protein DBR32_05085 [Taibaiella sp. KBW10]
MERIHNLLRKIQDLYYNKEEKQIIDVDLMLDYTRVLYADLLEWKDTIQDTAKPSPVLEPESAVVPEPEVIAEETVPNTEETVAAIEAPVDTEVPTAIATEETTPAQLPVEAPVSTEEVKTEVAETEAALSAETEVQAPSSAIENDEPLEVPEDVIEKEEIPVATPAEAAVPEAEKVQTVINDDDYPELSEVPVPAEKKEAVLAEKTEDPVHSEIHFELPVVNDEAVKSSVTDYVFERPRKDIRSFIGINDKYQFMNELFGNNKTAYEETLDKINFCGNLADAERWISKEATKRYNWSEEDVTYLSLLATIKKFYA